MKSDDLFFRDGILSTERVWEDPGWVCIASSREMQTRRKRKCETEFPLNKEKENKKTRTKTSE